MCMSDNAAARRRIRVTFNLTKSADMNNTNLSDAEFTAAMTKERAQQILFEAMVEHVHVTDDPLLREALETLCPHTRYVYGGSMGAVCEVCGLMPPEESPCNPEPLAP